MPSDPEQARNKDHFAIVIGINRYSQFRRLRAAVKDATRFAAWLELPDGGGLPRSNIHLINSPEEEPDPSASTFSFSPIQDQVDEALANIGVLSKLRIGARLYFYFAGHGFGPTFDDVGMLMANAAEGRLRSNVGLSPYRHFFRDWGFFDEVVFILDCCRDEVASVPETTPPTFTLGHFKEPRPPVNDFILMAAPHGEKAFQALDTDTGERRGLLTEALLEALKLSKAADARGRFTDSSLREYVLRRVPELAGIAPIDPKTREPLEQKPEIDPPQRAIMFGAISVEELKKLRVRVRIVAPAGIGGVLELLDPNLELIGSRNADEVTIEKPPWEELLLRQNWYLLKNTTSQEKPPIMIDLREVKDDQHVITFK